MERAAASLRDVARCCKVFVWFGRHFAANAANFDYNDFANVRHSAQAGDKSQRRQRLIPVLQLSRRP